MAKKQNFEKILKSSGKFGKFGTLLRFGEITVRKEKIEKIGKVRKNSELFEKNG